MEIGKFLLATKDEGKRSFFSNLLDRKTGELFFAFSPEDALSLIASHKGEFDLFILDFSFPDGGAVRCLRELKNHPTFKRIPVIGLFDESNIGQMSQLNDQLDDFLIPGLNGSFVKKKIINLIRGLDYENDSQGNYVSIKKSKAGSSDFLFSLKGIPDEVKGRFSLFSFFDVYRIVELDTRMINHFDEEGNLVQEGVRCYETWKRSKPCVNCISQSCLSKKQEYIKVEHFQDHTFIIAALPLTIEGKRYSIEFVKDATSELLLADHNSNVNLTMNAYLRHMTDLSGRDLFSGLHNKDYVNQALASKLSEGKKVEAAFLDIDKFKGINDRYGHLVGDEVILYLASLLLDLENKNGLVCGRVGGDEFLIFGDQSPSFEPLVETALSTFESHVFSRDSEEFKISISAGLDSSLPNDREKSLIERIDKKMYEIKQDKNLR